MTAFEGEGLIERFGTIEAIADADREQLLDVEGIGAATADRIHPRMSRWLEWIIDQEPAGVVIPTWVDRAGVLRHASERPAGEGSTDT